jgi:hypothetical protein
MRLLRLRTRLQPIAELTNGAFWDAVGNRLFFLIQFTFFIQGFH